MLDILNILSKAGEEGRRKRLRFVYARAVGRRRKSAKRGGIWRTLAASSGKKKR